MLRDRLLELWEGLQAAPWFRSLPPWLREPPGLYYGAGGLLVLLALAAYFLWLREAKPKRLNPLKELERSERRELAELRRLGHWRALGERYREQGKSRDALDAFRRGGCHAEAARLLDEMGKAEEARRLAREGRAWGVYAELSERAGASREAAEAYLRDGQPAKAGQCFKRAGLKREAASAFLEAGQAEAAAQLLLKESGPEVAAMLERAATTGGGGPATMERTFRPALRRAAQLWLEAGEAERAYDLLAGAGEHALAIPIARDHLPPSHERAQAAAAAGALEVAAEIYHQLGEKRQEALLRADHALAREQAAEAARWFEAAEEWGSAGEQWAAAGELGRAAELYERAGELRTAAELYGRSGDAERQRALLDRLEISQEPTSSAFERSTGGAARPLTGAPEPAEAARSGERYVLRGELGRGGMGVVYRAHDRLLEREVAFKLLSHEQVAEGEEEESLLVEARSAAKLSHPNIVQVYDAGHHPKGVFIVMELVEGETIQALLRRQRFSIPGAVYIGRQICAALAHAHERRIIHRDLKPSNLIWTPEKRVKLTDFGLARAFEAAVGTVLTRPAGTPSYMAPEQIRGGPVGPATDLYALGCVLFELLCGRAPFAGGSSIYDHLSKQPEHPAASRKGLPPALDALVLRCLEKDPEQRPASAAEVARELAALS